MKSKLTVEFIVDDADVAEVHSTFRMNGAPFENEPNVVKQLRDFIQLLMYDHEDGPSLEGEFNIVKAQALE